MTATTHLWDLDFCTRTQPQGNDEAFVLRIAARWSAQVTGIFGPSGCGKSTLLETLLGLRPRAMVSGRAAYAERPYFATEAALWQPPAGRRLGWVPQESSLLPHLSVAANLRLTADPARYAEHLPAVASLLGLTPFLQRRPKQLSGGERQRAAIARALLCPHDVLLLDEPMAALDKRRRDKLTLHLQALKQNLQTAMLYVSHDWQEIARLCDYAIVLDGGAIAWQGVPGASPPPL